MDRPIAEVSAFDSASAVRAVDEGIYEAEIDPAWQIADKPNGGYLMALCARAALDAAGPGHPHPVSCSAAFVTSPQAGPVRIEVEVLKRGKRMSVVRARLGSSSVEALVTCGNLPDTGPWWSRVEPPELPDEAACLHLPVDAPGFVVPINSVLTQSMDPAVLGWAWNEPSGSAETRGYVRMADGSDFDPVSLLVAVDCPPPATFELGASGWVPTMQLAAFVRAAPAPGPLRVRLQARSVYPGTVDETCEVWDSLGRHVATGHQLAGVRLPEGPPAG